MRPTGVYSQAFGTLPPKLQSYKTFPRCRHQPIRASSGFGYEDQVVATPGDLLALLKAAHRFKEWVELNDCLKLLSTERCRTKGL